MRKMFGKVIMDEDEYDLLMGKMKDLQDTVAKLIQSRNNKSYDRTITILRDDLGKSQERIDELKSELSKCEEELEGYREEALRQIREKKAPYERVRKT
jgi:predicted  nucleic acid-binding Zn-ribbon protein